MPARDALIGMGMPAPLAAMLGSERNTGLTGAGTSSQANALLITAPISNFSTVGANSGARLPPAGEQPIHAIYNGGASALTVYPSTGQTINAESANTGVSVTNAKTGIFIPHASGWFFLLGA